MQLSARLEAVASCVKPGRIIADIGTDHAYLPCALIERGVAVKAYACDIAPGPLKRAQNTIAQAGLQRQIIPILTPGLQDVPAEVQTVIIAGMGWISAREILEQAEERLADLDQIIVQVNREVSSLRRWIMDHGFQIQDEKIVHDRHFYQIVVFSKASRHVRYSETELDFGVFLTRRRDETFVAYCRFQRDKLKRIQQQVTSAERRRSLQGRIGQFEQFL